MSLSNFVKKLIMAGVPFGTKAKKMTGINDGLSYLTDTDVVYDALTNTIIFTNQTSLPGWLTPGKFFRTYDGAAKTISSSMDANYVTNVILAPNPATNDGVLFKVISVVANVITVDPTINPPVDRNTGATSVTLDGRIAISVNDATIVRINTYGSSVYNTQNQLTTGLEDGSGIAASFNDHFHSIGVGIGHSIGVDDEGAGVTADLQVMNVTGPNLEAVATGGGNVDLVSTEPQYSNSDSMLISVGGYPAGTSFPVAASVQQIINGLLYPELFGTLTPLAAPWTNGNGLALTQAGFREIGEVVTLNFTATYSRGSINPQYLSASPYRTGLPNAYNYTGAGLPASVPSVGLSNLQNVVGYTVLSGAQNWTGTVSYDIGVQPKGSNGTDFNTPFAAGTTPARTATITGVYPYYAMTVDILTMTKQALASMSSTYVQTNLVAESGSDKQTVDFPVAWSAITGIQFYNTVSSAWEWINGSKANSLLTFTVTATTHTIQGNVITYNRFTHNGALIGARMLRWYTN